MAKELSFPSDSDRPPFISKIDNFKREKCKKQLDKIRNAILSFHKNPDLLPCINELFEQWKDLDEKKLICEHNDYVCRRQIFAVPRVDKNNNDTDEEMVIKSYRLPDGDIVYGDPEKWKKKVSSIFNQYYIMHLTNILFYHEIFYDKNADTMYISMEKLEITLEEYVKEKNSDNGDGIDETECKQIIADILDNLWTLNLAGYVHGDIKPANIMLRNKADKPEYNGWKLIDYDTMYYLEDKTHGFAGGCGTIEWTPPEIDTAPHIMNVDSYTCYGNDIWSIGLIILYILFGTQPYILSNEEDNYWMLRRYWYYTKLLKNGQYDIDSDKNEGEIWIKNYLIKLYAENKISQELFDMLFTKIFHFDPRKRANPKDLWNHKWMKSYKIQQEEKMNINL